MPLLTLTPSERLEVRKALVRAFRNPARAFPDLLAGLNRDFADYVVTNGTFDDHVDAVLVRAEAEQWLEGLLRAAASANPDPVLAGFVTRFTPRAPPEGLDHFDACCLIGGHMMVNRSKLRDALRDLYRPHGRRILVVQDQVAPGQGTRTKTGKSHTVQLISYLHTAAGGFELAWIDLEHLSRDREPGKRITPSELAKTLLSKTRCGHVPVLQEPSEQWSTWINQFLDDAAGAWGRDEESTWWIVIDINGVLLSQPTADLIKSLAARVNVDLPRMRLIVLGWHDTFPPEVMPNVHAESVARSLTADDLIKFFRRAFVERRVPEDREKVADLVIEALEGLDPERVEFLPTLSLRITERLP